MAYGVYIRDKSKENVFGRCGTIYRNRKGFLAHKDYRFETLEQAECYAKGKILKGYDTKIKEVK